VGGVVEEGGGWVRLLYDELRFLESMNWPLWG